MLNSAKNLSFLKAKAFFLEEKEKERLIRTGSVSPLTLSQYGYHLDHLLDFLVNKKIKLEKKNPSQLQSKLEIQKRFEFLRASWTVNEIITEDIERYLIWHTKNGSGQSTLSTELYSYRSFWKLLKEKKRVEVDIAAPIKRKAQAYQEAPHLKEKHIEKFQNYLRGMDESDPLQFRNKVLFSTICKFGCRITEALTLKRKSILLKSEEVICSIQGKGNKKRVLPLPLFEDGVDANGNFLPKAIPGHFEFSELLERYFKSGNGLPWFLSRSKEENKDPFIFQSTRLNRLGYRMALIDFHKIINELRLDGYGYSPHSLRHTAATNWLNSQVDLKTVSELLGHASVLTTGTIYSHSEASKLRRGLSKSL